MRTRGWRTGLLLTALLSQVAGAAPGGAAGPLPGDTPQYTLYAPVRTTGPETLLVVFPGGFLPAASQAALARAVQTASGHRLWVGVAKFTGDLATPAEGEARIAQITAAVAAEGFTDVRPERTFLAGHSLGGVMATVTAQAHPVRGVLLWAAYVPRLPGVPGFLDYPRPVLTLAGDLDGRSRVTRPALDAADAQRYATTVGADTAAARRPVVVVTGANHSSFGDGAPLSNDVPAELTTAQGHARIAELSAAFLDANGGGVSEPDARRGTDLLHRGVQDTLGFLAPFLGALEAERGAYCEVVQQQVAAVPAKDRTRLRASNTVTTDAGAFAGTGPTVSRSQTDPSGRPTATVGTVSRTVDEDHTGDQPSVPVSARQVGCRTASAAAVAAALHDASPGTVPDCAAVNAAALSEARSAVPPLARKRADARGRPVRLLTDSTVATPQALADSVLVYRTAADGALEVGSARYDSTAERSCQLLSPARAVEYVLVDSLK